jgi:hypothetical protein
MKNSGAFANVLDVLEDLLSEAAMTLSEKHASSSLG